MAILNLILGSSSKKIKQFKSRDAIVLDVRSKTEYESGAIHGAKHIPLTELKTQINTIREFKRPVITCCTKGVRSANAASILRSYDIEAINGGGWTRLNKKLELQDS